MVEIRPQPGPQENFIASSADIAIYGGAAGGGKTWALLLEPLRHIDNPGFGAVFFRRTTVQIRNEGGLWDESEKLYYDVKGDPAEHSLAWRFPSGANISFAHLEHEKTRLNWQGSQIPLICFDELTHFSETQFWYMLSRNRSMCGIRPYVRATCNPDPDSWVADFISWWIDQETGYAIPERSGVVRWFVRQGETIIWGDSPEELLAYTMNGPDDTHIPIPAKSATFISAMLTDNKALMDSDPGYMANLLALSSVERERLLGGNWKISASSGMFKRDWFQIIAAVPSGCRWIRGWDLAATDDPKAAWTAGVLMGRSPDGDIIIADVKRIQGTSSAVERLMVNTASQDGVSVKGSIPQDPGQAGKAQVAYLVKQLQGYNYTASPESGDKVTRAEPLSAQAEVGNVKLVKGDWNDAFLDEITMFPVGRFKDQVDAATRAFAELVQAKPAPFMLLSKRS